MPNATHYTACLRSMKRLKFTTKWRFILTAFSLVINSLTYFLRMYTQATLGMSPGDSFLAFVFLVASLVLGGYILYVAGSAAAYPEKTKTLCILIALLLLARLTNIVLNVFTLLIPLWATQFFQIKKAKWLIEQEGYPYFSERFEEQKLHTEYVPTYTTGNDVQPYSPVKMPEISEMPDNDVQPHSPVEMPGISEIPDIPEIPAEDPQ